MSSDLCNARSVNKFSLNIGIFCLLIFLIYFLLLDCNLLTHSVPVYLYSFGFCCSELNVFLALRYYYKYVVSEQWRHSSSSPTERDERGNVNNVIVIGDIASVRPSAQQQKKVCPKLTIDLSHKKMGEDIL